MPKMYTVTPRRPRFNALFYGDPGSGKTTLAASAQDCPEMADVLFCNIEGGLLSIAHRGDIRAIDIESCDEVDETFWKLKRREDEYRTVKTVVLDSGTELQTMNLQEVVRAAMEKGRSKSGKQRDSEDEIWQDDYGKSTAYLRRTFRQFKDLPHNLIVTALAKYTYPKSQNDPGRSEAQAKAMGVDPLVVLPSMTQKVAESLMGYMDFVWYTFYDQEDDTYKVLTKSSGPYRAKTRGPHFQKALGDVVKQPTLQEIYQLYVETESRGAAAVAKTSRVVKKRPSNRAE